MNKKLFSIDTFSYVFKLFTLIALLILFFLCLVNFFSLFEIVFSKIERNLCIYKSILNEPNLISDFLLMHNYEVYGSKSFVFLDNSTNILGITIFLRIFEILKYIYLGIISFFAFKLFSNYSKNKIFNKENNSFLLIISILLIIIPFIYLLRDLIGCIIINSYLNNENLIRFENFKIFYLLIGVSLLFKYLYNKLIIEEKKTDKLMKTEKYLIFIELAIVAIYFIINLINFISLFNLNNESFEYYELIKANDSFIKVLANLGFEIFGSNWTYIGLYTSLKVPMFIYYLSNIIGIISLGYLLLRKYQYQKDLELNIKKYYINNYLFILLVIINMMINLIISLIIINSYKQANYPNPNLEYSLLNYNYFIYLFILILLFISSLSYQYKLEKKEI